MAVREALVETLHGRIRGAESSGIHVFRGIRYAAAPVGPRRFLPPAPVEPWPGTIDALRPGDAPPQRSLPLLGSLNAAGGRVGEDCLTLNVWTPGIDGARRPVLVWIHGGGFLIGSGSTPIYDGERLARHGDLVVVTIHYRLGVLGYLHLGTLCGADLARSTNLGVRDQIAALEWVRDNIERFGGNPGNVTVFGQSAGAMSIGALLGAPRARALFHRAICQSGAAEHVIGASDARLTARVFIEALGGPPTTAEALGRIALDRILRAQTETVRRLAGWRNLMVLLPVVDGDVIPEPPIDAIRRGAARDIPLLVGTTLDEWKLFHLFQDGWFPLSESTLVSRLAEALGGELPGAPAPGIALRELREALGARSRHTGPADLWNAFQSARVFHHPAARLAEAQEAGGGDIYTYLFTWRAPGLRRRLGACHSIDIPFVFGSTQHPLARPLTGLSSQAADLSRTMQRAWTSFARTGAPVDGSLPAWEPYGGSRRRTMILGRRCALEEAPLEAERLLLERWHRPSPPQQEHRTRHPAAELARSLPDESARAPAPARASRRRTG